MKKKKKLKKITLTLSDDAADGLFVELLKYWGRIFNFWDADDAKKKAAIKTLLEFMQK